MMQKANKSELWVGLAGLLAAVLSPKLGLPEEALSTFILSVLGLATAYIAGRSYAKPREEAAKLGKSVVTVTTAAPTASREE